MIPEKHFPMHGRPLEKKLENVKEVHPLKSCTDCAGSRKIKYILKPYTAISVGYESEIEFSTIEQWFL
jgi:hypothetical protein